MFGRLKNWRRIATRYNRCPAVFLSAVALAATVIFWIPMSPDPRSSYCTLLPDLNDQTNRHCCNCQHEVDDVQPALSSPIRLLYEY